MSALPDRGHDGNGLRIGGSAVRLGVASAVTTVAVAIVGLWFLMPRASPARIAGVKVGAVGGGVVTFAAFSFDGKLACVDQDGAPWSVLWRPGNPDGGAPLPIDFTRGAVDWAPDRPILAAADRLGQLQVYDFEGSARRVLWGDVRAHADSVAWSPDGRQLAIASEGFLTIREMESGKVVRTWSQRRSGVPGAVVAWSPDGSELLAAGIGGAVFFDSNTSAETRRFRTADRSPERSRWSPGMRFVLCRDISNVGWPSYTAIYDVTTGHLVRRFECREPAEIAEWSPNGALVLLGAGSIRGYLDVPGLAVIDVRSGRHVATLMQEGRHWIAARWLRSPNAVVAIRDDGEIWKWELPAALGGTAGPGNE